MPTSTLIPSVLTSRTLVRDRDDHVVHLFAGQDAPTGNYVARCGVYQGRVHTMLPRGEYLAVRDLSELTCPDCRNTIHP